MRIIVTIIPIDDVKNLLATLFWSGDEKYFCFLFIVCRALLQRHVELNRFS